MAIYQRNMEALADISNLENLDPELVLLYNTSVKPLITHAMSLQEECKELEETLTKRKQEQAIAIASLLDIPSDTFIRENLPTEVFEEREPSRHFAITLGLSYILLLGINQHSGIELTSIDPSQYPMLLLNMVMSFCITWAIERIMYLLGCGDADRSHTFEAENKDLDPNSSNPIDRLRRSLQKTLAKHSKNSLYTGMVFIGLEIAITFPGLIGLLNPRMASTFVYQFAMFGASGLAATTNVFLAYHTGVATSNRHHFLKGLEHEFKAKLSEIRQSLEEKHSVEHNLVQKQRIAEANSIIVDLNVRTQQALRAFLEAKERALRAWERWQAHLRNRR